MIQKTKDKEDFTKYEIARILGARSLQIAMDAPILLKIDKEKLEEIQYDPLKITEMEFDENVLPITVKRPLPKKVEGKLARDKEKEKKEEQEEKEKKEEQEEKEIEESGEIMELAKPAEEDDETENEEQNQKAEEGV